MSRKSTPLQPVQKFGRLTVISKDETKKKQYYICKCECGKEKSIYKLSLTKGITTSCGCFQKEKVKLIGLKNKKHCLVNTRIYRIWGGIKSRCLNKNSHIYKYYGGRGITVCNEWKNNFMSFYNWAMNNGYKDNLTIDRIDVNGNYEPSNCRWASIKTQERNRRNNRLIIYKGNKYCLSEISELLKIRNNTLHYRLKAGWSFEKAFNGDNIND